jgi:hypothetical protein
VLNLTASPDFYIATGASLVFDTDAGRSVAQRYRVMSYTRDGGRYAAAVV